MKMKRNKRTAVVFGVFVISHGRPNKVKTVKTMERSGYTGPIRIVCDDEDAKVEEYRSAYPDRVLVFDKKHYARQVDSADNFNNRRTTTHARNACFDFAKALGWTHFLVLDDDYCEFRYLFNPDWAFSRKRVRNFDALVPLFISMLDSDPRIASVCMLQGGDLIGGGTCSALKGNAFPFKRRKAMNTFFCATNRRFWFYSRLNEDVNTYLTLGREGRIFLTIPEVMVTQSQTQGTEGGMTSSYLSEGTYVKTFYSVMMHPSCVVATLTPAMGRIHHQVAWNHAVPKILPQSVRKVR